LFTAGGQGRPGRRPLVLLACVLQLAGCASIDYDYPRDATYAIDPATETPLKRLVDGWLADNPGPSGFYPVVDGTDALGLRIRLMREAERTIDVQYFLMKPDAAGIAFATALLEAADRGVRVRFLLDDIFTTINDGTLMLLDRHENIEVRIHNPVAGRAIKSFSVLTDFRRANRRMHNKSFTVDNQVMIVGGRNIADEYFGMRSRGEFLDLDIVGIGPVAGDVSRVFDLFWNDTRSIPLAALRKVPNDESLERARIAITREGRDEILEVMQASGDRPLVTGLLGGYWPLYSAEADVITDDPRKLAYSPGLEHALLAKELRSLIDGATREVIVLTPYFVPGDAGIELWRGVVERGVRVVLVTNSLASNNHIAVHAGYSRYRKAIIESGVELYEVRADAGLDPDRVMTLHIKAFVIDRERAFIGSLNLDPRSLDINTEMGVVVHSPGLATLMAERVDALLGAQTWRVTRDDGGSLRWSAVVDDVEVTTRSEPEVGLFRKLRAFLSRIIPDSQL
jgi:putative cardiolipin synthase